MNLEEKTKGEEPEILGVAPWLSALKKWAQSQSQRARIGSGAGAKREKKRAKSQSALSSLELGSWLYNCLILNCTLHRYYENRLTGKPFDRQTCTAATFSLFFLALLREVMARVVESESESEAMSPPRGASWTDFLKSRSQSRRQR